MKRCQHNGLVYYRFDIFESCPELVHGVFTRHGGVSRPPCAGLNLAFMPEDADGNVRTNMNLAAEALNFDHLAFAGQVHGDQALLVTGNGKPAPANRDEVVRGYDALMTRERGIGLLIKLADCQGVILYDPKRQVVAAVHSGWRGSVANILGKTVARLERDLGVDPADLLAGVGPSLGPCCAEFVNFRDELPAEFHDFRVSENHFDFWAISRAQLAEAGVRPENVETAGMCTVCGSEGFFSYRREKVTGRFGLVAGLQKEQQ